jgi:Domain of unknown function (DUF4405)
MSFNRPKINLIIDVVAFICAVLLITTGFLLEYVLPPGSGRLGTEGFGIGPGGLGRPILLLWGLTRHDWGNIHFYLALSLMAALSLHLVLHWQWIVCMVKGKPREASGIRVAVGVLGLVSLIALALAPLFTSPERMTRGQALEERQEQSSPVRH